MGEPRNRRGEANSDEYSAYFFGRLFQLAFWLFMVVIGLNIIAGIIIDTFASMRAHTETREARQKNFCLVCGLDRIELDRRGTGFERHGKFEHDMWNYAYMFYYILRKDHEDLTGEPSSFTFMSTPFYFSFRSL